MDAHDARARPVGRSNLLNRSRVGKCSGIGPSIHLRHQHAQQTERPHFLQFVSRKAPFPVPSGSAGRQPLLSEPTRHLANLLLKVGKDHLLYPGDGT